MWDFARAIRRTSSTHLKSCLRGRHRLLAELPILKDDLVFRGWMKETIAALGGLDILVANASSLVTGADEAAWQEGLDVDILGTVRAVEEAQPHLEASECGSDRRRFEHCRRQCLGWYSSL